MKWEERFVFLNLIKEAIDCKISFCEFYNQFTEKEDQISNLAIERELNLNLKPPTRQAAIIFSILSRIVQCRPHPPTLRISDKHTHSLLTQDSAQNS